MENLFNEPIKKLVSPREFASFLGVNRKAVNDAIAAHRLEKSVSTEVNGYHNIDVPKAVFEWFGNADPSKDHDNKLKDLGVNNDDNVPSFSESKRLKEHYLSKITQLEYEEKAGNLVPRNALENELFQIARTLRDRFLLLAETLSPRLVGLESSELRIQMRSEIEKVLDLIGSNNVSA